MQTSTVDLDVWKRERDANSNHTFLYAYMNELSHAIAVAAVPHNLVGVGLGVSTCPEIGLGIGLDSGVGIGRKYQGSSWVPCWDAPSTSIT